MLSRVRSRSTTARSATSNGIQLPKRFPVAKQVEINLAGPTYVSLLDLARHTVVAEALDSVRSQPDRIFLPRIVRQEDQMFSVYSEDPAYESGDPLGARATASYADADKGLTSTPMRYTRGHDRTL